MNLWKVELRVKHKRAGKVNVMTFVAVADTARVAETMVVNGNDLTGVEILNAEIRPVEGDWLYLGSRL